MLRRLISAVLLMLAIFAATDVYGRAGQAADDCPPGSKDPDCASSK